MRAGETVIELRGSKTPPRSTAAASRIPTAVSRAARQFTTTFFCPLIDLGAARIGSQPPRQCVGAFWPMAIWIGRNEAPRWDDRPSWWSRGDLFLVPWRPSSVHPINTRPLSRPNRGLLSMPVLVLGGASHPNGIERLGASTGPRSLGRSGGWRWLMTPAGI